MKKRFVLAIAIVLVTSCVLAGCMFNRENKSHQEIVQEETTAEIASTIMPTMGPTKPQAVVENQTHYEQLNQLVENGKSIEFALYLLNNDVSTDLFVMLLEEDQAAIEYVLVDAMVSLAKENRVQEITMLRKEGYVSDTCFLDYWEVMGSVLPDEDAPGTDPYLIHELNQAYLRDSYVLRSFNLMRTAGILDDSLHATLVDVLGFDYTNVAYVEQNQLSPLVSLTEEEKASYESILDAIDKGDSLFVVEKMLLGEVSEAVYAKLMEDDPEIMNYVIAEGMAHLMEMMRYQDVVRLRVDGFVSDTCFVNYWEILGCEQLDRVELDQASNGEDAYLLYELEQIFHREDNGQRILQELWYTGLISDVMQQRLIQGLGFDYTRE